MRILIAPDKFKGTLTAAQAAKAIADGIRRVMPDALLDLCPIADGGEGTLDALTAGREWTRCSTGVLGPLGDVVTAPWGLSQPTASWPVTAVIESSAAAGLLLVPSHLRSPMSTTAYGVGQIVSAALDAGARRIILALGGSATNEGGASVAQALGVRFLDRDGSPLSAPLTGSSIMEVDSIDLKGLDSRIALCELVVLVDVDNPLWGPNGASCVFAPQKFAEGLSNVPQQVEFLDRALRHIAELVSRTSGVPNLSPDSPGTGAAGGMAYGIAALLGGRITRGAEFIFDATDVSSRLASVDLVVTGEGRLDASSTCGKAAWSLGKLSRRSGIPVLAICGQVDQAGLSHGRDTPFNRTVALSKDPTGPLPTSCDSARQLAHAAADTILNWIA